MGGPLPRLVQVGKFYPPVRGGMERHLQDQSTDWKDRMDVRVLVAHTAPRTVEEVVDGVRVTRVGTWGSAFSTPLAPTLSRHLSRLAHADGIVHLHLPNPAAHLAYLAARPPGALVVTWHSDVIRPRALVGTYGILVKRLLARAARILVTSPTYRDTSVALAPFRERCRVVPPGVRLERFRATPGVTAEAERIRREHGPGLVLFVGRLAYYKGLDVLLEAAERLYGRLLLVGDGPLAAQVDRGVRERGLQSRVHRLPDVDDLGLAACYHACDVLVLPSTLRSEAFGLAQAEAMACGRPVVTTDLDTGVTWVNRAGETGSVVPVGDPPALVRALNRLLADPDARAVLGAAARRRVEAELSREAAARAEARVFQEVLGRPL